MLTETINSMEIFDEYKIISHFQALNPEKLVVYVSDDITIYIADRDFFSKYEEKRFRSYNPIPFLGTRYIECVLDGSTYFVERNEKTEYLLNRA